MLANHRKVIGARFYSINGKSFSARSKQGHGTHVASIAAGNEVRHASFFDLQHKELLEEVIDDVIAEGVDIITIAVALQSQHEPTSDVVALGALHALRKGILTVSCAGNSGPRRFSVSNDAPWLLTVAASHIDRRFIDKVLLGDGSIVAGTSINCFLWSEGKVPIVYGNEVTNNCSKADAGSCYLSCLEESRIHGKVVMCDFYDGIDAVKAAGALGCIAPNLGNNVSDITTFPTAALSANDFNLIKKYKLLPGNAIILLHLNPEAKILKSEAIRNPDAPFVASDSSRGPSIYFPDLIKKKLASS
ncbi:subtilisin-like protease SBT4.3 [Tanacetum coccineum]